MIRAMFRGTGILAVVLLAAVAFADEAHARSLTMEEMDVELRVGGDGILHVTERLRVRFDGSWNGIFRNIPYADLRYGTYRRTIGLRVDAVEDGQGEALEHWRSKRRGRFELKIRVPGASDATREVVIRYRAMNVLLAYDAEESTFGGHDELYWNVVGGEWEFPIERVSCRVILPEAIQALGPDVVHTRVFDPSLGLTGPQAGGPTGAGPTISLPRPPHGSTP